MENVGGSSCLTLRVSQLAAEVFTQLKRKCSLPSALILSYLREMKGGIKAFFSLKVSLWETRVKSGLILSRLYFSTLPSSSKLQIKKIGKMRTKSQNNSGAVKLSLASELNSEKWLSWVLSYNRVFGSKDHSLVICTRRAILLTH